MTKQIKWYAIAYNKKPNSMIGQAFSKKEYCEKLLPLYKKKGWTGGIVRVNPPKPISEEDKKALENLSGFLKGINQALGNKIK